MADDRLDTVGYWTEIKLRIIRDYSAAYSTIMSKQSAIRHVAYIDGFAGAGKHISKSSGEEIDGSPKIALLQRFDHFHFVDLNGHRANLLRKLAGNRKDVSVYEGDCNRILLDEIFPKCLYEDYRRALCILDPYKLNPNWNVVKKAGDMRSVEIFLNFMIMDANMNVLRNNPENVDERQILRMNAFWGDDSWKQASYTQSPGLFGDISVKERNEKIIAAYRDRLKKVAGFKHVPEPLPMKNSNGAVIYYLFFASHNKTGEKIANAVFNKYRDYHYGC